MITCRFEREMFEKPLEHIEACRTSYKSFRTVFLTESSQKHLDIWNNKPTLCKYYPTKIISAHNQIVRLPACFKTSTKYLQALKLEHPGNVQVSSLEPGRNYNSEFRKAILASRRIKHLEVRYLARFPFTDKSLQTIAYLTSLRSLDINLTDGRLPAMTKIISSLHSLESISMLFRYQDLRADKTRSPHHFLGLCEKALSQKDLRIFNLDFDNTIEHYSTEVFEILFLFIDNSKVERWNICAMLAEDEVLRMAESYRVFREAQHIAINSTKAEICLGGLTAKLLSKVGYQRKMLNIYLRESFEEDFLFDLESVVKQCPAIEDLHVSWKTNLPKHNILGNDDFGNYKSLRIMNFETHLEKDENIWQHLLKILENSPCLEKFSIKTFPFLEDPNWEVQANDICSCVNILTQIKTLKSVKFKIPGGPQKALDALGNLFETIEGLKELNLRWLNWRGDDFLAPKIPFYKLTQLTQLRLWVSEKDFQSLCNAIPELIALRILSVKESEYKPLQWLAIKAFMSKLKQLPELKKFSFASQIEFDKDHNNDIERHAKIVKEELVGLVGLVGECRTLEVMKINYRTTPGTIIEYKKEMNTRVIM